MFLLIHVFGWQNWTKTINNQCDWTTDLLQFTIVFCWGRAFTHSCFWVRLRTKLMGKAILPCRCETWIVNAKSYCDLQLYRNCECQDLWQFEVLPQLWMPRSTAIRQFACAWCCPTWTQWVHTMLQHMRPRGPPPLMYCNIVKSQTGCERIVWRSLFVLSLPSLCNAPENPV